MTSAETHNPHADCQRSLEELYQYVDDWLDGETRSKIRQHLDSCTSCEDVYRFQATFVAMISTKCRSELPDELRRRILEALEESC